MKKCIDCKNILKEDKLYLKNRCRLCFYIKQWKNRQAKRKILFSPEWHCKRFWRLRKSAKDRNLVFELTKNQVKNIYEQNKCFFCGETEIVRSIDRLNNKKGYILDNCVLSCLPCNKLKGTILVRHKSRLLNILSKL